MYHPKFAKSFSRHKRKSFGCFGLILYFLIAFSVCSTFKPHLHPLSVIGNAVNLQFLINDVEEMLIPGHSCEKTVKSVEFTDLCLRKKVARSANYLNNAAKDMLVLNNMKVSSDPIGLPAQNPELEQLAQSEKKKVEPLCTTLKADADYCEFEGEVRVDSNSSTVFLVRPRSMISESNVSSWIIEPYPRKKTSFVKKWTVTLAADDDDSVPECAKNHTFPAVLFSIGGFSGNHFHDFADLIVPLYSTSFKLKREVHFLASDYKPWWSSKFHVLLDRLTRYELLDIDREKGVHCYNKIIAGLQFHKDLIIDPSFSPSSGVSMSQFRQLLRQTYSLERRNAIEGTKRQGTRPRLMIVSRKRTRILNNEAEISRVAKELGYEVVLAEEEASINSTKFAPLVNSCDVMMGIHGAGLTNMVFLPDNAILIQVIPLGAIDRFARLNFGNPAPGMNIRYLEYKIKVEESSLFQQYRIDHPILKDPLSVRNGWGQLKAIYLENQNVTIDIHRFKGTLAKALKLLSH